MDTQSLKAYIEKLVKRGSSGAELARKCGISDTAMSQFRSGKYGAKENPIRFRLNLLLICPMTSLFVCMHHFVLLRQPTSA